MRRIAAVVAALMLPVQAQALGVGEIDWSSALNQPLDAKIALFAVGKTSPHEIKVKLAPYAAYQQANIEFPSILRELKFSVEQHPTSGELYIKVRSSQAVQDPFLDILIEIDWPNGHLLREYTLLLDLPVMTDEVAGPISRPVTTEPGMRSAAGMEGGATGAAAGEATGRVTEAGVEVPAGAIYGTSTGRYGAGGLRYGMVRRGDTLWAIAESMRGDRSVSIQQIMMALLRSNPEAFYNNNINNLKAGYVLRLDSAAMLDDVQRTDAAREVKQHHRAWLAGKKGGTLPARASSVSEKETTSVGAGGASGTAGPSLKLVSPDEAEAMTSKAADGDSQSRTLTNKGLDSLRQELSVVMEASASGQQENTELRGRITELEDQISKMQRLLTLRDDALSLLQLQSKDVVTAAVATEAAAKVAADAAPEKAADTQTETAPETVAEVASVPAQPAVSEVTVEATKEPVRQAVKASKPEKPVPSPASEQGVIDDLLGYVDQAVTAVGPVAGSVGKWLTPTVLGGVFGGALLLGGGVWFIRRRKMSADDLEQSMMIEVADKQLSEDMANGTISDPLNSTEETAAVDLLDSAGGDAVDSDLDEIDVLAEADVYIAYQRFDRAEELMREAVEHEPQRHDLMLKLMEVFVASKNNDGFIEMAERCKANGGQQDAGVWSKVVAMANEVEADHPMFSDSVADAAAESEANVDDDDLGDIIPGADMDFGSLDDDLMAGLDDGADSAIEAEHAKKEAAAADDLSNELTELGLDSDDALVFDGGEDTPASDDLSADLSDGLAFDAGSEASDDGLDFDLSLDMAATDESAETSVTGLDGFDELDGGLDSDLTSDLSTDLDSGLSDDLGAELEMGLDDDLGADLGSDLASGLDEGLGSDLGSESSSEVADDHSMDFDLSELSLDSEAAVEATPAADEPEGALDAGLEFEATVLESATSDLEALTEEDDVPAVLEANLGDAAIDDDLSEDIDWLTSVADDAVEGEPDADSFFSSEDEVATKLDLIRAYIDMGDRDSARNILTEVVDEGNDEQKQEAQELLNQIG